MIKTLLGLVIDSDVGSRGRLREAIRNIVYKPKLVQARNYLEGLEALSAQGPFEVVFIGSSKSKEELVSVVRAAKESCATPHRPIIILCLKTGHLDNTLIAELYLEGVNGFIAEPYSTTKLQELITTANEAVKKNLDDSKKQIKTLNFLFKGTKGLISEAAIEKIKGNDAGGRAMKKLKDASTKIIETASEVPQEELERILLRAFDVDTPGKAYIAAMKLKRTRPKTIHPHPGQKVRELMEKRNLSVDRMLELIKLDEEEFQSLLSETGIVDERCSRELSRVLGQTAQYWLSLQTKFNSNRENEGSTH